MLDDRQLAYKDRFSEYLTGIIVDNNARSISDELALSPDTINSLVIDITGEDFTKLFASALTGSILLYGEAGEDILWYLWKAASVNNYLCSRLEDCLELGTNELGETILINKSTGLPISTTNTLKALSIYDANTTDIDNPTGDDNDCRVFGASMQLVDYLNVETRNWLAAIAGFEDIVDAINLALSSVPFIGTLYDLSGFDTAVDAFTNIGSVLLSAYDAAWDVTLQRDMACRLYCAVKDNNYVLTRDIFEQVLVYWLADNPTNAARSGITILGTWTTQVAYRYIAREYTLGLNNPDCDVYALCTSCVSDIVTFDAASLPYTVQRGTVQAAGNPGNALVQNTPDGSNQWWVEFTCTAPKDATSLQFDGFYEYSAGANSQNWLFVVYVNGVESFTSYPSQVESVWLTKTHAVTINQGDTVNIRLAFGGAPSTSGNMRIDNVVFIP